MKPPVIETCDMNHKFYKEEGTNLRCPHCLALGFDGSRREIMMLRRYGNKDCTAMADEALQRGEI